MSPGSFLCTLLHGMRGSLIESLCIPDDFAADLVPKKGDRLEVLWEVEGEGEFTHDWEEESENEDYSANRVLRQKRRKVQSTELIDHGYDAPKGQVWWEATVEEVKGTEAILKYTFTCIRSILSTMSLEDRYAEGMTSSVRFVFCTTGPLKGMWVVDTNNSAVKLRW